MPECDSGPAKQLVLYVAILQTLNLFKLSFTRKKQPQDDERLVQLFKNRAGLKKAHQALEDEVYALKERVKQQVAGTTRVQEQLEAVEGLLGNPDAGHAALVYYQLRGLWRACNGQLATFASELERQQEDRERRKQAFEFNQQLNARVAAVEKRLSEAEDVAAERQRVLDEATQRLNSLNRIWHYFKRRKVAVEVAHLRVPLDAALAECAPIREEREALRQEQCPAFPGLGVEGRRAINLATIGYALVLGVRLGARGLAPRAKDAMARRVQEVQYGSRAECEALMDAIGEALGLVRSRRDIAGDIKECVEQLRAIAQYRAEGDTVPLGDSLAGVMPSNTDGAAALAPSAPQILADDYWQIYQVLLR
ncbi:MAG TPA: hypothetical protein VJ764_04085 [Steroidobacteraceae bacterium]|nr:hypothetical protein [Steroidobacteraceae bacterium]